jgi:hypothetical protein
VAKTYDCEWCVVATLMSKACWPLQLHQGLACSQEQGYKAWPALSSGAKIAVDGSARKCPIRPACKKLTTPLHVSETAVYSPIKNEEHVRDSTELINPIRPNPENTMVLVSMLSLGGTSACAFGSSPAAWAATLTR